MDQLSLGYSNDSYIVRKGIAPSFISNRNCAENVYSMGVVAMVTTAKKFLKSLKKSTNSTYYVLFNKINKIVATFQSQ